MITSILLLIWAVIVAAEAGIHYYFIEVKSVKPIYLIVNILRGIVGIVYGAVFWTPENMTEYWPVAVFQFTCHYAMFSPLLNWFRAKPAFYSGLHSGWIDKFLSSTELDVLIYMVNCVTLGYFINYLV